MSYLYITGYFNDSFLTLYNNNTASNIILNGHGGSSTYIAKYDLNGNAIWGSVIGGLGDDQGINICTDNNAIYVFNSEDDDESI